MTHSGATQAVEIGRPEARPPGSQLFDWSRLAERVRGPLLTLGVLIVMDLLTREGSPVVYPFPVLLLTVVYAAYSGGLLAGLVSALLTVLYGVHFFSEPGLPPTYRTSNAHSLLVIGVVTPLVAVLVARLRSAADRGRVAALTRAEAEAMDRRVTLLSQVSVTLASSLDYEVTLRDLAKTIVPTLADWCAIHVITEEGVVRFVAGAHRDPARDLLVRVLCEHGERKVPFDGVRRLAAEPTEVTEELLRQRAEDDEHRKLYRALRPSTFLHVPLRAGGRLAGVITLAMSKEYGRAFEPQDLRFAAELAERTGLAVGAGRAYHEAREAERRYRLLFEANPQPMWAFDVETLDFLAVNDAAIRYYGYSREEFLSMTIMDIRSGDDATGLPPAPQGGQREEAALTRHQRKDGTVVDVELVSHELEMNGRRARLVMATDITDRTRTRAALHQSEEQLRQAQRHDAVGRLAGGVAHDFNNILTTIRGFGDILLGDMAEDNPRRADVDQIRKAADRGVLLTGQLLTFGQRQIPKPQLLDLHQVIRSMEGLIRRLVGADIRLDLRLVQGAATLRMDSGHLEQLLVNIILNARDAMPQGGTLTVETAERHIGGAAKARRLRPGPYILLAIRDTGAGMDAEARSHLFEPFYSGEPREQRAGLGLSIVYGIVRQNGGVVRVSSEPGQGTTIKVYLPKAEPAEPAEVEVPEVLNGTETVLLAEDEDGVRELLRQILIDHGHAVLEARHGRDALALAERYERPIDLLVTDVVMPEMGGGELVERLRQRRPNIKTLYISGYTSNEVIRRGVPGPEAVFLHKPFTADELMRRVREVLDGTAAVT